MNIADMKRDAENGQIAAQVMMGVFYLNGIGVEVNYPEALRLLTLAASRGSSRASINLARIYQEGLGAEIDMQEAFRHFLEAAKGGEFFAQIALGRIYSTGDGVAVDNEQAWLWYSAALAQKERVVACDEIDEAIAFLNRSDRPGASHLGA